jgi:hypothetical protein
MDFLGHLRKMYANQNQPVELKVFMPKIYTILGEQRIHGLYDSNELRGGLQQHQ